MPLVTLCFSTFYFQLFSSPPTARGAAALTDMMIPTGEAIQSVRDMAVSVRGTGYTSPLIWQERSFQR